MAIPVNDVDVERFKALTNLFLESRVGEIKLYTSKDSKTEESYVSIELAGSLDTQKVNEIFTKK